MIYIALCFVLLFLLARIQYFLHKKMDTTQIKYGKRLLVLVLCSIYSLIAYAFFDISEHSTSYIVHLPPLVPKEESSILDWISADTASFIVIVCFFAILLSPFVAITYYSYNRTKM
jgi:LytS/YehU family sensor histidine kinase